jgi:hypothetical protein
MAFRPPFASSDRNAAFVVRLAPVLLVRDVLHPLNGLAVEHLGDGDMRHADGRRCAVPVLHPRRNPDDVAGADLLARAVPVLHQPDTRS